jgi:hypothetical protein
MAELTTYLGASNWGHQKVGECGVVFLKQSLSAV